MTGSKSFGGIETAISGMIAERRRMRVIASNIANANTIAKDGTPYTRKTILFNEVLGAAEARGEGAGTGSGQRAGVDASEVVEDTKSEYPRVFNPGHPAADANGFVRLPNVNVMFEMVDLMIAKRSYGANIAAFRAYRSMLREAIQEIGAR